MNVLDAILLGLMIAVCLYGLLKGIAHLLITLAGFILAFFSATQYYHRPAIFLSYWFQQDGLRNALGFAIIFLAVLIGVMVFIWFLREFLKTVHLRWLDRTAGGLFGLFAGYCLAILCLLLLTAALSPQPPLLANSVYAGPFLRSADFIASYVPGELKDEYQQKKKKLERYWRR